MRDSRSRRISIMSSRFADTRQFDASRKNPAATPVIDDRPAVRVDTAANDDTPTSAFTIFGDPLWGMAIVSGILFALLAALVASS
jgi:hypothetical protein